MEEISATVKNNADNAHKATTLTDRAAGGSVSPIGEFGWGGAAGSYVMIDQENRLAAFYGQHMRNNLEPYVHPRLRNTIYGCL